MFLWVMALDLSLLNISSSFTFSFNSRTSLSLLSSSVCKWCWIIDSLLRTFVPFPMNFGVRWWHDFWFAKWLLVPSSKGWFIVWLTPGSSRFKSIWKYNLIWQINSITPGLFEYTLYNSNINSQWIYTHISIIKGCSMEYERDEGGETLILIFWLGGWWNSSYYGRYG